MVDPALRKRRASAYKTATRRPAASRRVSAPEDEQHAAEEDQSPVMAAQQATQRHACSGQAIIEACLVVALAALLLFGVFQVALLYAAGDILDHAAVSGARAATVGLNDFMVTKSVRASVIPNAGTLVTARMQAGSWGFLWHPLQPGRLWSIAVHSRPVAPQLELELARIPLYLGADWPGQLPAILDYTDWRTVHRPELTEPDARTVRCHVRQDYPLRFPFHRAFYNRDHVSLFGEAVLENHAALYLQ